MRERINYQSILNSFGVNAGLKANQNVFIVTSLAFVSGVICLESVH